MSAHAAVVYNPAAVPLDQLREQVAAEELRLGWAPSRWYATQSADSGRGAARDALADDPAVVAVAGGDGTVRTVAAVVHGSGTPLALLPFGTGNLLARNLGLPLGDVAASIRTAFAGATRNVDVPIAELLHDDGERSRHVFLVMAGLGLDAEMARFTSSQSKKRLGWLAYVTPIARSVIANRRFRVGCRVDGGDVLSTRAHTVIVGNCGTLAGGLLLLPDAVVDDGLLDMVMLRPRGWFGWARVGTRFTLQGLAHRSRLGKRVLRISGDLEALAYSRGRRLDLRFDSAQEVELDGDGLGPVRGLRVTLHPAALQVCVPA